MSRHFDAKSISINLRPVAFAASGAAMCLAFSQPAFAQSPTTDADTVIITGRAYNELATSSATKTESPQLETPQSVQVITKRLIDDRRPVTLTEALYNASGVSDGGGRRATFDFPIIRGFDASTDIFLDGLRIERGSTNFAYELMGLERIEVLKGPSSVLYGQGALGGAINQVSKRPSEDLLIEGEMTLGTYDFMQARLDVSGRLADGVYGRLNGLYRANEDAIDFLGKERTFIAPSLTFELGEDTTLTLLGAYTKDDTDGSYIGLPAQGSILPNVNGPIPMTRNIREPGYDHLSIERSQIGYALEHNFSDNLALRQNLRFSSADVLSKLTVALALFPDQRTLMRGVGRFENQDESIAVDTNLTAKFNTGGIEHTLLAGVDVLSQGVRQSFAFGLQSTIDIFNPVYFQPVGPLFPPGNDFDRDDSLIGFYIQDQIRIGDNFTVVAGGRFDSSDTTNRDLISSTESSQEDDVFVPRIGAIYEFAPGIAAYANYAQAFRPNFGADFSGDVFDAEEGESYELGIKTATFDNRLNSTFAVYDITRTNVLTPDPDPLHAGFNIATGEQRSRGFDADVAYAFNDNWNLIFAYAYTDIEITRDTDFQGNTPINVPKHQASVFSKYEFTEGPLAGVGLGLGARHVGDREGTLPNSYRLPAYTTVDVSISYRFDDARLQLNIYNLLDEEYFPSSASTGGIGVLAGEPLTARLTLGYAY